MNKRLFKTFVIVLVFVLLFVLSLHLYNVESTRTNTQMYCKDIERMKMDDIRPSNNLSTLLDFEDNKTYQLPFQLINRNLPASWYGKKIIIKYTYLGKYNENTVDQLNNLLSTEYNWKKQLDNEGNILLGGPIFLMDNVYQLHTHNGLSLGNRHYLFGDLLHYLYKGGVLEGTQISFGDIILESIWVKDIKISQDASTLSGADLVVSTCLEMNGDRRLISGWKVIEN